MTTSFNVGSDGDSQNHVPEASDLSFVDEAGESSIPLKTRSLESPDQTSSHNTKTTDQHKNSPWSPYLRRRSKITRASRSYPLLQGVKVHIARAAPWIWEILSWLTALSFMAATITVLAVFDQKHLPQWHWGLTLNALVSIFVTFTRSALMVPVSEGIGQLKWIWFRDQRRLEDFETFDEPSRGPWGSLSLL